MARRIRQRRTRTTTAVTRYGCEVQQSSQVFGDSGWGSVGQSAGGDMAVENFSFLYNWVSLCSDAVMLSLPFLWLCFQMILSVGAS